MHYARVRETCGKNKTYMSRLMHTYLILLSLLILLGSATNRVQAQALLPEGFTVLEECPFVVCSEMNDTTQLTLDDSQFNHLATSLVFRVNRIEVDYNQPFFLAFNSSVIEWLKHEHFQIEKIFIRGAASPEGPYLNNKRLGMGRTQNMFEIIEKKLHTPDAPTPRMESQSIIEDYRYLLDLLEADNDPEADTIRALFESVQWDEPRCKIALQRLNNGQTWARLLKDYFPRLRSARIVIWVKRYTEAVEPIPATKPTPLETDSVYALAALDGLHVPEQVFPRIPVVALRTNLVRDLFYMPKYGWAPTLDVQLEYMPLRGHYTANLAFSWSNYRHYDNHHFFQIRDAQVEVRRYFKGSGEYWGPFVGLYAEGIVYGVGLNAEQGWQGEGWGAGLDAGYSLRLTKKGHLRMEFGIKLGYLGSVYDPYVYGNPITGTIDGDYYYNYLGTASKFKKRNHLFTWFGPTDLSIALTYDIIYRPRKKITNQNE